MLTRLSFRSPLPSCFRASHQAPLEHLAIDSRGPRSITIGPLNRPALVGLGQLRRANIDSGMSGPSKPTRLNGGGGGGGGRQGRNLTKELEDGIKPWTGPSIFSVSSGSRNGKMGQGSTPPRTLAGGSSQSPIAISSAETTPESSTRVRGVIRYASPGPRTAYTPPPKLLPNRSNAANTRTNEGVSRNRGTEVHPFFNGQTQRTQRSRTLPPSSNAVPASQRPRYVAHYSSTDASTSQSESQSQSTQSTLEHPSQPRAQDRYSQGRGKGKARDNGAKGPPEGWTDDAVNQLAEGFAATRISTGGSRELVSGGVSRSSVPPIKASSSYSKYPNRGTGPMNTSKHNTSASATYSKPKPKPKSKPVPAEPDPNTTYFQYTSLSPTPKLAYTTDPDEADLLISCLKGSILGFDLEWPPAGLQTFRDPTSGKVERKWIGRIWDVAKGKYVFTPGRTALVQVCDGELIVLVHLKDMKGESSGFQQNVLDIWACNFGVEEILGFRTDGQNYLNR